ncbi:unnamed protein product, partial [Rotaria magnacalcarata]
MHSNFLSNTFKIQVIINKTLVESKDIDNAMHLFSSITNKSNYMYTVMFKGLITNNVAEKVLDLFDEMKIEPNQFTLSTLFNACAVLNNNQAKKTGKKLLDEMPENYRNHNITSTSAINMLMKFGDVETAQRIFRSIKKTGKNLLDEMPENYRNHNITSTSAIDMLTKFGDVESAERVFRSIKAKNIITYGAMVKGYVGNETFEKALDLFEKIEI